MAVIVKACCLLNYGYQGARIAQAHSNTEGKKIVEGQFKDHVDAVAKAMGIGQEVLLIEAQPLLPRREEEEHRKLPKLPSSSFFSSKGSCLIPSKLSVIYRPDHPYEAPATRFLLTKAVAELKANHNSLHQLASVIVGLVSTILFCTIFPVAGLFLGALTGYGAGRMIKNWNANRVAHLIVEHTSAEERKAGFRAFKV